MTEPPTLSPPSLEPAFLAELATLIENLTPGDLVELAPSLAHAFQRLARVLPRRRRHVAGETVLVPREPPPRLDVRAMRLRQLLEAAVDAPTSLRQLHAAHGGKMEIWADVVATALETGLVSRSGDPWPRLHLTAAGHQELARLRAEEPVMARVASTEPHRAGKCRAMLKLLGRGTPMTQSELRKRLGGKNDVLGEVIETAIAKGLITRSTVGGPVRMTEIGFEALRAGPNSAETPLDTASLDKFGESPQ